MKFYALIRNFEKKGEQILGYYFEGIQAVGVQNLSHAVNAQQQSYRDAVIVEFVPTRVGKPIVKVPPIEWTEISQS